MFRISVIVLFFIASFAQRAIAQGAWNWRGGSSTQNDPTGSAGPGGRTGAAGWTDGNGNFWLFGGSRGDGYFDEMFSDLWRYNTTNNQWTLVNGTIDPNLNTTASRPGARINAASWLDSQGNLWLMGGIGYDEAGNHTDLNDLWKYTTNSNTWTFIRGSLTGGGNLISSGLNATPASGHSFTTWTDALGQLWLFGGVRNDLLGSGDYDNRLWRFNTGTGTWSLVKAGNTGDSSAYGIRNVAAASNLPSYRKGSLSCTDSQGNLWLFGGYGYGLPRYIDDPGNHFSQTGNLNDLWKYDIATGNWVWVSGDSTINAPGSFGTKSLPSTRNVPPGRAYGSSWFDTNGNLWMMGGQVNFGFLSSHYDDLWKYNISSSQWIWVDGSSGIDATAQYTSPLQPGSRQRSSCWKAADGSFWLFGGNNNSGSFSDFWQYTPGCETTLSISPTSGIFCNGVTSIPLTASGAASYTWLIDGQVQIANGPNFTATQAGVYNVRASVPGCGQLYSYAVELESPPIDPGISLFGAGSSGYFCENSLVGIGLGSTTEEQTYEWVQIETGVVEQGPQNGNGTNQSFEFFLTASELARYTGAWTVITRKPGCQPFYTDTVFVAISQVRNAVIQAFNATSVTFTWDQLPVLGFDSLEFEYVVSDFPDPFSGNSFTTRLTSIHHTGLLPNTTYFIYIRPICASGNSDWTQLSFTTCSADVVGNITPNTPQEICAGSSVQLTASGGNSYQWLLNGQPIAGATGESLQADSTGVYSAIIRSGGCGGPAPQSVLVNELPPLNGSLSPTGPVSLCSGGSIQLQASGGNSFEWYLNNQLVQSGTTSSFVATQAGTYTVRIQNGNCSFVLPQSVNITISATAATLTPNGAISLCTGSSQQLQATGGTSYEWYFNNVLIVGQSLPTLTATQAGTYSVIAVNGTCRTAAPTTATVSFLSAPSGSITPVGPISICAGSNSVLTATGGSSYEWYFNNQLIPGANDATLQVTQAGSYEAILINGTCRTPASNSVTVSITPNPVGSITANGANNICEGGSVQLQFTGTGAVEWYKDGILQTQLSGNQIAVTEGGLYSAEIINGNCRAAAANTVNVTVSPLPAGSIQPIGPVSLCPGSTQIFTANGGDSYEWYLNGQLIPHESNANLTASMAGTYSVVIIRNNCRNPASNSVDLDFNGTIGGQISPAGPITLCPDQSTILSASIGSGFQWFRDGVLINGANAQQLLVTQPGLYSVHISSGNCQGPASNSVQVNTTAAPSGSIVASGPTALCPNGFVTLTASGGTSYEWYLDGTIVSGTNQSSITVQAPGSYSVIISNGVCTAAANNNITVTNVPIPVGNISPAGPTRICAGSTTTLTASGGILYDWYLDGQLLVAGSSGSFDASAGGNYSVVIYNNNGCSANAGNTVQVIVDQLPQGTIMPTGVTELCPGGSRLLTSSGGNGYQWYRDGVPVSGATTAEFNATIAGVYTVLVSSENCSAFANGSATIRFLQAPVGTVSAPGTQICPGQQVPITVTGGVRYQWYKDGQPIANATGATYLAASAGTYTATIYNAANCSSAAGNSVTLTAPATPIAGFETSAACVGQPANFVNTSTGSDLLYTWRFGDNTQSSAQSPSHIYVQAGSYQVELIVTSATCTTLADTIQRSMVVSAPVPAVRYPVVRVTANLAAPLSARELGISWQWEPPLGLSNPSIRNPLVTISSNQTYTVRMLATTGCITIDTVEVQVFSKATVFVPTAFTPNSNGANDLLRPLLAGIPVIEYFKVFNRWGQLVYETNRPGEGWNGLFRGSPQPADTYSWIFVGKDAENRTVKASGKTILIR